MCSIDSTAVNARDRLEPYAFPFLNYLSGKINDQYAKHELPSNLVAYHYTKLPSACRRIRLMNLHPASTFQSVLRCDLIEVELGTRVYEALSYVWGSNDLCHAIICDEKALRVPRNLYRALHFLRRKTRSRLLWVDAVCIDQSNAEEKDFQIPLMRDIYSQARRSLIWLGEASAIVWARFLTLHLVHPLVLGLASLRRFQMMIRPELPLGQSGDVGSRWVSRSRVSKSGSCADQARPTMTKQIVSYWIFSTKNGSRVRGHCRSCCLTSYLCSYVGATLSLSIYWPPSSKRFYRGQYITHRTGTKTIGAHRERYYYAASKSMAM